MKKKTIIWLASLAAFAPLAHSSVSFDIQLDMLQTENQGEAMSSSGVVMLLADTGSNGFGAIEAFSFSDPISTGFTTDGSAGDDLVLWYADLSNNGIDGLLAEWISNVVLGTYGSHELNEGDALALAWFPEVQLLDGAVGSGVSYGLFAESTGSLGSVWTMPTDGSSAHALYAFTDNSVLLPSGEGTGQFDANTLLADQTTVPEPASSAALFGLATLASALVGRRRTRRS